MHISRKMFVDNQKHRKGLHECQLSGPGVKKKKTASCVSASTEKTVLENSLSVTSGYPEEIEYKKAEKGNTNKFFYIF